MTVLRIASRASALAMAQTRLVERALTGAHPGLEVRIVPVKTAGDRQTAGPLWKLSGSGFFTAAVEQALIDNVADIAVHSFKDLPTESAPALTIAAVPQRLYPQDAMVCRMEAGDIEKMPEGASVGTSSPRRIAQLRLMRPDMKIADMRGNVETRLAKLDRGDCDAVILARAGLERLGLGKRISFCFDPARFLPAPAQGAMAVQARTDDKKIVELAGVIDHRPTSLVVTAERTVLTRLHPGCHSPVGVFAELKNADIAIRAFVADTQGKKCIRKYINGPADDAVNLARRLAGMLMEEGAVELINRESMQ